jgi:hypothetical protein
MKTLPEDDFIRWAISHGLGVDKYRQTTILRFQPTSGIGRFWNIPDRPERRSAFISSMLELAGPWETCFAWRHMGSWPDPKHLDLSRINDVIELELLKGIGIPLGTHDVLELRRDDFVRLVSLVFVTSIFGWSVGEDLYLVPDNSSYLLKTDHHGVIHVEFREAEDVVPWISKMNERGFPLPDDLPDETFKKPVWMDRST